MSAKYTFDSYDMPASTGRNRGRHRRQYSNNSEKSEDVSIDAGSLTYSAASSVNSAAGESTDSSFAGIMRVLDEQGDSKELAAVLEKERMRKNHGDRSVFSESQNSLAYSTDADSHMRSIVTEQSGLKGTKLVAAGQTSDQYSYDGGHYGAPPNSNPADESFGDLFAPAEHADSLKRRKDIKRKERKEKTVDNPPMSHATPRMKNSKKGVSTPPGGSSVRSRTPPTTQSTDKPPKSRENYVVEEEEDVWYAKWWMFCFPDVQTMTPKR